MGIIKGDTRSLDNCSYGLTSLPIIPQKVLNLRGFIYWEAPRWPHDSSVLANATQNLFGYGGRSLEVRIPTFFHVTFITLVYYYSIL